MTQWNMAVFILPAWFAALSWPFSGFACIAIASGLLISLLTSRYLPTLPHPAARWLIQSVIALTYLLVSLRLIQIQPSWPHATLTWALLSNLIPMFWLTAHTNLPLALIAKQSIGWAVLLLGFTGAQFFMRTFEFDWVTAPTVGLIGLVWVAFVMHWFKVKT